MSIYMNGWYDDGFHQCSKFNGLTIGLVVNKFKNGNIATIVLCIKNHRLGWC